MAFTAVPRVRVVRAVQLPNALPSMTVFGVEALAKVTVFNEVHPKKAMLPTEVTEAGMLTLVSFLQSWKAHAPMVFTAVPRVRVVRAVQPSNAEFPMTVFGVEALAKVTVFNEVQSLKAKSYILVTVLGMVTPVRPEL